ncbi:hypothetical protein P7C73_g5097, partial [Tremellales sp. Uapishka_1]
MAEQVERAPLLPSSADSSPPPKYLDMVPTTRDKVSLASVVLGLVLFLPLTWYMVFSADLNALGWFALHPPMQSLAITAFILGIPSSFLCIPSSLTLCSGITPLQPSTSSSDLRKKRLATHQTLLLGLALPALAVGTAGMWWNKHVHGAKHFTTWHSWFGVACVVQALIGGASVWFGGKLFGGESKARKVYKYHRLSGYLLITLALLTAHLGGAHSSWALGNSAQSVRVVAFWIGLPLVWIGLEARSRPSKMKFL